MADRQRVYHPVTGEAFDVPVYKAVELRLEKGWHSQPVDPDAVPYVQTVEPVAQPKGRVIEVGCDEACEAADNIGNRGEIWPDDALEALAAEQAEKPKKKKSS